jgi:hypothetical protein
MSEKRFGLVVTTIHVPRLLADYVADVRAHGRTADLIVVGDEQTPAETWPFLAALDGGGVRVVGLDLERQNAWLARFPELARILPLRSIQRRNLGTLIAFERGADVIVFLDDDNYLRAADFLAGHAHVGERSTVDEISSDDGWLNVCDWLTTTPPRRFYHRGFPFSRRWRSGNTRIERRERRVMVNAGLWVGDPDVDTVTRLEEPFRVDAFRAPAAHVALARGTWSPFNSQNTAFAAELLPFAFLIVAGRSLRGVRSTLANFRYDDIWMSYCMRLAIDHLDHAVTYGEPIVEQRRNPHDLLIDLDRELVPMLLTEPLVAALRRIELRSTSYLDAYAELIDALAAELAREPERRFFEEVLDGMRAWLGTCVSLIGRP